MRGNGGLFIFICQKAALSELMLNEIDRDKTCGGDRNNGLTQQKDKSYVITER